MPEGKPRAGGVLAWLGRVSKGKGKPVPSAVGTQALWDMYPTHVRHWINSRGGLSAKMMFLRGKELMSMYPECRDSDWMR